MTHESVTDYLGHPCRFTEAKSRFSESYDDAQAKEFREIKRNVGRLLLDLNDRLNHAMNASRAIRGLVASVDDADEPLGLLELLAAYELDTVNIFCDFAGLVLAGFESGGRDPVLPVAPNAMQGRA